MFQDEESSGSENSDVETVVKRGKTVKKKKVDNNHTYKCQKILGQV